VFNGKPLEVRTLAILYPGYTHSCETGSGIKKVSDLKGKRVSTGAPGSGTEVMALRFWSGGISHEKGHQERQAGRFGILRERSRTEDRCVFLHGRGPRAILTLRHPGMTISIVFHDDLIPAMVAKSGPIYYKAVIPKKVYSGLDEDVPVSAVGNLLMTYKDLDETLAYNIMKTVFDRVPELIAIHKRSSVHQSEGRGSEKGSLITKGHRSILRKKGLTFQRDSERRDAEEAVSSVSPPVFSGFVLLVSLIPVRVLSVGERGRSGRSRQGIPLPSATPTRCTVSK